MTAYDAMLKWQENIPVDLQIVWFGGYRRDAKAAYYHICVDYQCLHQNSGLLAVAMTRQEYLRYRYDNPIHH